MSKYALVGEKLSHSLSPQIHKHILEAIGEDGSYELVEIERGKLKEGVELLVEGGFAGFNVTIPYKQSIMPFLDEISEGALSIGAVNTVKIESGRLKGYNTDLHGFETMVKTAGIEVGPETRSLVIGTGGAAKMAAHWLDERTRKVWFLSRNARKSMEKLGRFQVVEQKDVRVIEQMDFVVNCSPCGMYPHMDETPLDMKCIGKATMAADLVYNPLRTLFVQEMERRGGCVARGLDMLVAQACRAQEIWNDVHIDEELERSLMKSFYFEQSNPVLIGMPGSGKSAAGKHLADLTNREFVDTDALIEDRHGPITEIFKTRGEAGFRTIESEIVKSLRNGRNLVIATGGGAILDSSNVTDLKSNGVLIYLNRSIENIEGSLEEGKRPLLKQKDDLEKLYLKRKDVYLNASDLTVGDAENADAQARIILDAIREKKF